ncbi:peptidase inhibitor family I36 protein [Actinoplanes siamensis]|uniref:Peptidase inhibitor family I36 n=1 Tax=Actinoplanes siamensis TaxID=1223317 RepID=A0A919TKE6_9ACTN|nr:peptidase inhibitor family I36 protein [Actinoplanes siamensis]GIF05080.1 hypothetical protein Asi03nite_26180 [Actinoplanes siamensis]
MLKKTAVIVALIGGVLFAPVSSAVASPTAPAGQPCPAGNICFYKDINFEGRLWSWNRGETEQWLKFTGLDEEASSIINNTSMTVRAHRLEGNRGDWVCVSANGGQIPDLGAHNLNDAISSFQSSDYACIP